MSLKLFGLSLSSLGFLAGAAFADTISPDSYSADLALGESVTISKTVVVSKGSPKNALVDAYFLIDTTGSMTGAITAAKTAASTIFSDISTTFGEDVAGGVGVFGEGAYLPGGSVSPPGTVMNQDITTSTDTVVEALGNVTLGNPDFGGDDPESSRTAIDLVANNASWRPGSSRFIFAFSDASAKGTDDATVVASLAAQGITLVALDFGGGDFSIDMTKLGGIAFSSTATPESIVDSVTAGITAGFASYGGVTIGDLGAGDPMIDVSVACTSADSGMCDGANAVGSYDRSVDRTFTFDVTFTRTGAGDANFLTHALVDGRIVASEADTFNDGVSPVPLPAAGWLLLSTITGLGVMQRRRRKAA